MKRVKLLLAVLMILCLSGCSSSQKAVSTIGKTDENTIHLNKYLYYQLNF